MTKRSATVAWKAVQGVRCCEVCGWGGHPTARLVGHHCWPLADGGKDEAKNMLALCPNCHSIAHSVYKFNKKTMRTPAGTVQVVQEMAIRAGQTMEMVPVEDKVFQHALQAAAIHGFAQAVMRNADQLIRSTAPAEDYVSRVELIGWG